MDGITATVWASQTTIRPNCRCGNLERDVETGRCEMSPKISGGTPFEARTLIIANRSKRGYLLAIFNWTRQFEVLHAWVVLSCSGEGCGVRG